MLYTLVVKKTYITVITYIITTLGAAGPRHSPAGLTPERPVVY